MPFSSDAATFLQRHLMNVVYCTYFDFTFTLLFLFSCPGDQQGANRQKYNCTYLDAWPHRNVAQEEEEDRVTAAATVV